MNERISTVPQALKPSEVLQRALDFFGPDGENWTHGVSADKQCSISAIHEITGGTATNQGDFALRLATWEVLRRAAGLGKYDLIQKWNDEHTWPEIKAAFEEAIKNCQQAESGAQ